MNDPEPRYEGWSEVKVLDMPMEEDEWEAWQREVAKRKC